MVTAVLGLTKCVSFRSLGEISNELVFPSDRAVVVKNCDVLLGQITKSKSFKTDQIK